MGEEFVILTFDGYTIYKNDKYYLCMSNEQVNNYQLYIGFSERDLSTSSKVSVVNETRKVSDLINSIDKTGIYILPIISPVFLEQAALENDDRIYNRIMNENIQPITAEIYHRLASLGKSVNQRIKMIKQNDIDTKIIGWLSMKLGDSFINEIEYSAIKKICGKTEVHNVTMINVDGNTIRENNVPSSNDNKTESNLNKQLLFNASLGYGNIKIIVMILIGALLLGVGLGCLLIK